MIRLLSFSALILLVGCGGGDDRREDRDGGATAPSPSPPRVERSDAAGPAAVAAKTIPVALRGRWIGLKDRCDDPAAASELTITPDRLIFHESVGEAQSVETRSDGAVAVRAAFTGEGESWTRTIDLRASRDGRTLTIVQDAAAAVRRRC